MPINIRVGTHRNGNFKSRISEHFLPKGFNLDMNRYAPKDRSIFRKNIGRALLNKSHPDYLPIWEFDFMDGKNVREHSNKRDFALEENIENQITETLKSKFSFRFIEIMDQKARMGKDGLESRLIGTLSHCSKCCPSNDWLGRYSSKEKIRNSGLWLIQHLGSPGITEDDKRLISV